MSLRFTLVDSWWTTTEDSNEAMSQHVAQSLLPVIDAAIQQAVAGAYQACADKMSTLNDEFWSAVASTDCLQLTPADAQAALDSLIERAIERCAEVRIPNLQFGGTNGLGAAEKKAIRALTPSLIRDEAQRKG